MRSVMRRLAISAFSVALGLSVAQTAAKAQTYDGSGILRVGAFGQMSAISLDIARVSATGDRFAASTSPSGYGAGIAGGYDLRLGRSWFVGIEADGSIDNGRSKTDSGRGFNSDFLATVRGRLGFDVARGWQLYGTAGYAVHGLEFRGLGGTNTAPGKTSTTQGGLVVGGGTEVDLDSYTLFAEVLHATYETWRFTAPDVSYRYAVDDSSTVARVGVKFKIGYDYDQDTYRRDARRY